MSLEILQLTFLEPSVFVAIECQVALMWCQSVMIEDHDDVYYVPMTCMVLEICDKLHKCDFFTLIVCGTVHVYYFLSLGKNETSSQ